MKNWFQNFLTSSIGRKTIMSLTGLFLIIFLVVHLVGNLQLLSEDGGRAFNEYTYFMTHNPLIKTISYGLYFFILLHAVQGIVIKLSNNKARGAQGYRKYQAGVNSWASKQMALLGILIFAFLMLHMGDFWFSLKTGNVDKLNYAGYPEQIADLYSKVDASFSNIWIVIAYLIGLIALALHLWHGFWSAFQTLGINHRKYTPLIKTLGKLYAILIPLGFAVIPIVFFLKNQS
ncbi:MAG: succinate dehydrogenase [Bacteroidetes bacterium]|nr:succinate dehydrogenase [Bacteroidota bacterium]